MVPNHHHRANAPYRLYKAYLPAQRHAVDSSFAVTNTTWKDELQQEKENNFVPRKKSLKTLYKIKNVP
jgi:hypothetical protein